MVRSDALSIIPKAINYEFSRQSLSIGVLSELTNLDQKTIKKTLSGKPVSAKVIRKLAYFFKVPPSFFSDEISDDLIELTKVNSWQNFIKELKIYDDFFPYTDIDLDNSNSKEHIEIIEEFIKNLTTYINTFNRASVFEHPSEETIDVFKKLAQTDALKIAIKLSEIARTIEMFANIFIGNQLYWKENLDTLNYGYITYDVTNKLIIEISNNSSPVYYTAPIGEIPNNPTKDFTKGSTSNDFRVNFINSYLPKPKNYFKKEYLDWSKNYDK